MKPIFIGLVGPAKSGKDSFYQAIKKVEPRAVRLAFADHLKEEVAAACGVGLPDIEEHKDFFRPMLQWWGTEFRRNRHGFDYWVDRIRERVEFELKTDASPVYVFTDVRFSNEADFVREMGGVIVRIFRPDEAPILGCEHSSETFQEDILSDTIVTNNGPIEALEDFASDILKRLRAKS